MSNFLHKGKRIAAKENKKTVKKSTKEFYAILGEIDRVADIMINDQTIQKKLTAENAVEIAEGLTDVKIEGLERLVLMGKLGMYEQLDEQSKAVRRGES